MIAVSQDDLAKLEKLRRSKQYPATYRFHTELLAKLESSIAPEAELARSRIYYEMSMVPLQTAWDAPGSKELPALYDEARRLANHSARHAHNAGDPIGVMFAEVNIGGHILPGLGKTQEGLKMLKRILEQAQTLLHGCDGMSAKRLEQVLSNTRILIDKNSQ